MRVSSLSSNSWHSLLSLFKQALNACVEDGLGQEYVNARLYSLIFVLLLLIGRQAANVGLLKADVSGCSCLLIG